MHAEWTIAALRAGMNVLCEKPFTMTAAEARRVVAVAEQTGMRVVEAFHDHYHPLSAWVRDTVAAGVLGRIRTAEAVFTGATPYAPNTLRHEPALGGGALMDLAATRCIGCARCSRGCRRCVARPRCATRPAPT
jgi:predicted dehydrogenase